jgi:hepatocyte growth factor-regulated tyrosine kinase substrate
MLSEMNDKLSQAVKLYDKLLTAQVSHPTWTRSPPPAQASAYQPLNSYYAYQTPTGTYEQWAPSQPQPQAQAPHVRQPQQPSYAQSPPELSLVSVLPPSTPQYNSQIAQSPAPYQSTTLSSIPQSPLPAQDLQARHPAPQPAVQNHASTTSPPASSSGLTRHNTTSYSRTQPSANTMLSRHNTVASAPPPPFQQQPSLPHFPVAPTSAPQSFPLYGPSIPQSPPQAERKEALLIDL